MSQDLKIIFREDIPSMEEYWHLFQTTGWNDIYGATREELIRAIANSQYRVSAYADERLVGFGRVLTDGVLHAMIYELIVSPEYQNCGLGTQIMERLVGWCLQAGIRDIQLFCARGKRGFYEKRGFSARPEDAPGMQYQRQAARGLAG